MRTTILISVAAAMVAVAACANDVAAPNAPVTTTDRAPTQTIAASAAVSSAQGKPTDQVGFSKVTAVWSTNIVINPGQSGERTATCPAGSTVIGGGHHFYGYVASASPPWIHYASANGSNGWSMHFDNAQPGASTVNVAVAAYCVS